MEITQSEEFENNNRAGPNLSALGLPNAYIFLFMDFLLDQ